MDRPAPAWKGFSLAVAACLLVAGCATSPRPDLVVHESQRGGVYLEPMANPYLEAAHPVSMPQETIARALRGVLVQGRQTTVQTLFESEDKIQRVFSDEDVAFLAPLIVTALSQAKPTQQVRFRVAHRPRSPGKLLTFSETGGAAVGSSELPTYGPKLESTSAALFVYGLSLHLTVTEFRQKQIRPDNINMPNRRLPDASSLDRVEFLFAPKAALRPESYQERGFFGEPHLTPIILDYELLAKLPVRLPPAPQPGPPPDREGSKPPAPAPAQPTPERAQERPAPQGTPAQDIQSVKELMLKKDKEMEALKEELQTIKKQLAEQDAQRQIDQQKDKKRKKQPAPAQAR
ncbi:MAG: hypothetical protein AB1411_06710 [Nitrospirota bacterium]